MHHAPQSKDDKGGRLLDLFHKRGVVETGKAELQPHGVLFSVGIREHNALARLDKTLLKTTSGQTLDIGGRVLPLSAHVLTRNMHVARTASITGRLTS